MTSEVSLQGATKFPTTDGLVREQVYSEKFCFQLKPMIFKCPHFIRSHCHSLAPYWVLIQMVLISILV